MKKLISVLLCIALLSALPVAANAAVITYYIDSESGDDTAGGTSESSAWKTVENLRALTLEPGTRILFRRGGTYTCACLEITASGTENSPILISSYGEGAKPIITTQESTDILRLFDCSYITVSDLEFTAPNGGGIWIDTYNQESNGIEIYNVKFHNIQNTIATSRDNLSNGACAARACIMVKGLPAHSRYAVNSLTITDCEMYDCGNGISIWGSWNDEQNPWCNEEDIDPVFNEKIYISGCYFHDMDAEALIFGMCDGAVCENCRCIDCCKNDGINDDGSTFCNAAMWFWGSVNSTIRCCEIAGQKTIADGMTCDFDSYTHYCTYEYIYSHNNARFVNNCPQHSGHKGNCIRYCLSVNDNAASSSLSQGCYDSNEYNLRFYNNTVVNPGEIVIEGVRDGYIADNIFCGNFTNSFRSARKSIDDETGEAYMNEFTGTMKNNCFWGTCIPLCSKDNVIANPCFVGTDETDPDSFRLAEGSALIGKGITKDCTGEKDIYGNTITGSPNIGCYAGSGEEEFVSQNFLLTSWKYISTVLGRIYQFIVDCNNKYWLF